MAKLYFKHGCMGAGKSLDLIRTYYNYTEKGKRAVVLKSSVDSNLNYDSNKIVSRTGESLDAKPFDNNCDEKDFMYEKSIYPDVILVDESQFLTDTQVQKLYECTKSNQVPVICYGLRVDFRSRLFTGSKRLFELAEDIQEIKSICHCGVKAMQNARIYNGKIVREGGIIQIGGNESYIPLCNYHYFKGEIK